MSVSLIVAKFVASSSQVSSQVSRAPFPESHKLRMLKLTPNLVLNLVMSSVLILVLNLVPNCCFHGASHGAFMVLSSLCFRLAFD